MMSYFEFGVFLPIANNGWIISTASPQYMPSFELNREITLRAERLGYEFVLSMVKWRGFGGQTQHWDHAMESFTLMAGLAAVTQSIDLYASVSLLTMHPAIVARMAATLDDISGGRFGLNVVTGWFKGEFSQMGIWPGDEFYQYRYEYATEYVQILKGLWQQGRLTYRGQYFQLEDCLCQPMPSRPIPIICAGTSERGLRFTAELGSMSFLSNTSNDLSVLQGLSERVDRAAQTSGREIGAYVLCLVIAAETDGAAQALAREYIAGGDLEALRGRTSGAQGDLSGSTASRLLEEKVFMGVPVIGSYASVAAYFDRMAKQTSIQGALVTFPEFIDGVTTFGEQVMPRMGSRQRQRISIPH